MKMGGGSDPTLEGHRDHFGLGVDMQLRIDLLDVRPDRFDGDSHAIGDHFVTEPVHESQNHFLFLVGECGTGFFFDGGIKILHDFARNLGRHGRSSPVDHFEGLPDFLKRRVLQQVTRGAAA